MNELDYVKSMFDKYISECENLSKEPPNRWTASAANKSKIKRLGIELRQEMIDLGCVSLRKSERFGTYS